MDRLFLYPFFFVIGSFLGVLVYRLPRNISLLKSSFCEHCHKKITWWQNIPFLSYFFLRARCFYCKKPIRRNLFFIEAITFVGSLLIYENYTLPWFYLIVFYVFICHFLIDLEHHLLLDSLNLYLLLTFIIWRFILGESLIEGFLGLLFGFLFPFSIAWFFYRWKKQMGMGGGDFKLYAALGMLLGPIDVFYLIFYSSLLGIVFFISLIAFKKIDPQDPLPFGPSIILVASFQIYFPAYYEYLVSFWKMLPS